MTTHTRVQAHEYTERYPDPQTEIHTYTRTRTSLVAVRPALGPPDRAHRLASAPSVVETGAERDRVGEVWDEDADDQSRVNVPEVHSPTTIGVTDRQRRVEGTEKRYRKE